MSDVTQILEAMKEGDGRAADQLLPLVYEELRRVAASKMAQENASQTLQPTALVHEAWLRLNEGNPDGSWNSRGHFFAAAAEAMRRILIDRARRRQALRHGAGQERLDVDDVEIAAPANDEELLAVHEALDRLATTEASKAELVKLRYFMGLTLEETATVLHISEPTAKRWWSFARAWLFTEIRSLRK